MDLMFFVDIEDRSGNKLGSGPIHNVLSWSSTKRMSRAGNFSFSMPASDPQRSVVAEKRIAKCNVITDSGPVEVGSGVIDSIGTRPTSDGNVVLDVSGNDLLRELSYASVHFQQLQSSGSGVTHSSAVSTVEGYSPSSWSFTADPSPPVDDIYYQFAGETVLAAVIKLAELSGVEFYLDSDRTLVFSDSWSDTGIRAIELPENPDITNPETCYISGIQIVDDSFDLLTRIYPYGAGDSSTTFGMADTTRSAPAGYTLSTGQNYIRHDGLESNPDIGIIERVVQFRDVEKIGSAPADDVAAANTLFDVALAELQRDSQVARYFDLSITHCNQILRPLQQIRCVFRRVVDGEVIEDINQLLNIIESTITIDERGLRTSRLQVGTVGRVPRRDTDPIVKLVQNSTLRV